MSRHANVTSGQALPGQGTYLWNLTKGHRGILALALVVSVISAGLTVAQPVFLQRMVNQTINNTSSPSTLIILIVLVVTAAAAAGLQGYLSQRGAESVADTLRGRVTRRYVHMSVREADRQNSADLLSRVAVDTTIVKQLIGVGLLPLLGSSLMLLGITAVLITIDVLLFLVSALAFLIGLIIVVAVGKTANTASAELQERTGIFSVAVERSLGALRTIKASNAQDQEVRSIQGRSEELRSTGIRLGRLSAIVQPTLNLCIQGAIVSVVLVGAFRLTSGAIDLGGLLAYLMYMFLIVVPIASLGQAYTHLQVGFGALLRCREVDEFEIEDLEEDVAGDDQDPRDHEPGQPVPHLTAVTDVDDHPPLLELRGAHFAYQPGRPVLRDIDLAVRHGEKVSIVGLSGSGKSTLLDLIERFYTPDAGEFLMNGAPAVEQPLADYRSRISLVPQEAAVVTGTLRENLTLGREDLEDPDLIHVLHQVGLEDLVERGEEGLDTDLGQAAVTLSSGQRQRIGWARALLSDAELLLMDEPDSNLDSATRAQVSELLDQVAQHKTVIVVSHRIDRLAADDRVVVMDGGLIVGDGPVRHLASTCSAFQELTTAGKVA